MKAIKKITKQYAILVILIFITSILFFVIGSLWSSRKTEPVISNSILEQKIKSIQELSTASYQYTNMGKFEDQTDFYGWKVPLTKKSFIIAYDGMIKAGVDMSKCKISRQAQAIIILLPKAEILSHTIDDKSIQVFDETKNIFNPISLTDYTGFSLDQKYKMEEKANQAGLLVQAEMQAEEAVNQLILLFTDNNEIKIEIKFE